MKKIGKSQENKKHEKKRKKVSRDYVPFDFTCDLGSRFSVTQLN